jgi:hypothetical protein
VRYESKTAVLRDGRCYTLRSPGPDDAPALLRHLVRTSGETDYMLRYPDEITLTEAQEREYLAAQERDPRQLHDLRPGRRSSGGQRRILPRCAL